MSSDKSKIEAIINLEKEIERRIRSIEEYITSPEISTRLYQERLTNKIYRLCQSTQKLDRLKHPENHQERAQNSIKRLNRQIAILRTEINKTDYLSIYIERIEAINSKVLSEKLEQKPEYKLNEVRVREVDQDKRRKYRISAKVSAEEWNKIIELQRAANERNFSSFIRKRALGIRIHTIPTINQTGSINIAKLIRLTRNISSNLNQGVKAIHTAKLLGQQISWEPINQAAFEEIKKLLIDNLKTLTVIQKHLIRKQHKSDQEL